MLAVNWQREGIATRPRICLNNSRPSIETDASRVLVVAACNHPNWLALPFRIELIRLAA